MLRLKNITKYYGKQIVLDQFCAEFEEGSTWGIMGNSGVGKSTLLSLILGLEKPDSGQIIGNQVKFSVVFQENRLCESFNAIDNIRLVTSKQYSKQEIKQSLIEVGITEYYDKKICEFSGGMKRRVAIVRAILASSDILIMDEPFKGLDKENKRQVIEYIKKNKKGRTFIFVTHAIEDIKVFNASLLELK